VSLKTKIHVRTFSFSFILSISNFPIFSGISDEDQFDAVPASPKAQSNAAHLESETQVRVHRSTSNTSVSMHKFSSLNPFQQEKSVISWLNDIPVDSQSSKVQCIYCDRSYTSENDMREHVKADHIEKSSSLSQGEFLRD
jgi:hypothetical protein